MEFYEIHVIVQLIFCVIYQQFFIFQVFTIKVPQTNWKPVIRTSNLDMQCSQLSRQVKSPLYSILHLFCFVFHDKCHTSRWIFEKRQQIQEVGGNEEYHGVTDDLSLASGILFQGLIFVIRVRTVCMCVRWSKESQRLTVSTFSLPLSVGQVNSLCGDSSGAGV